MAAVFLALDITMIMVLMSDVVGGAKEVILGLATA